MVLIIEIKNSRVKDMLVLCSNGMVDDDYMKQASRFTNGSLNTPPPSQTLQLLKHEIERSTGIPSLHHAASEIYSSSLHATSVGPAGLTGVPTGELAGLTACEHVFNHRE